MNACAKPWVAAGLLALGATGCATLTPEESCQAICSDLQQCQVAISGSTLTAGASCQADCLGKIEAKGSACKSAAAYLGECFQTYTCEGIGPACSEKAGTFAGDCG